MKVTMRDHFKEVCQYGYQHSQCRCASPNKIERRVDCNIESHRKNAIPNPAEQTGWLDPRPEKPHTCNKPVMDYKDIGRRWRCECGQIWVVNTYLDQRQEPHPIWHKYPTDYED